jgi:hypothetical protein
VSDPTPCTACGAPLQANAKFCGSCGTSVPDAPDAPDGDEPTGAVPPTSEPTAAGESIPPVVPSGEPTTGTTAFGTGDPSVPAPTEVGGVGPIGAPPGPLGEPGGFAAPGTPPGGIPPAAFPPTVANPTAAPRPPTLADQAVASSGGLPPGGAPPGGPPTGGERPYWMPDPEKETKSSRTGLFIVLGVAGGVLFTLIALLLVLVLGGDDGDEVSSRDTTTTTEASTTTTTERPSTTTTEGATTTTQASTTTTDAPTGSGDVAVGDCVTNQLVGSDEEITGFDVVDCDSPHRAEMFATSALPDGPFPSDAEFSSEVTDRCQGDAFEDYVGRDYQTSEIYVTGVTPTEESWDAGDHQLLCFGHEQQGDEVTASFRNSGR